jgi:hypothetical protein
MISQVDLQFQYLSSHDILVLWLRTWKDCDEVSVVAHSLHEGTAQQVRFRDAETQFGIDCSHGQEDRLGKMR